MGICIFKNSEDIDTICNKQTQFKIDENKNKLKCMSVWKINKKGSQPLNWPYSFYSSSSYIIIIANRTINDTPILQQDRTSIQLAQMLFGAQFLILHLKVCKNLMLNNKQYTLSIYSFYGDSVDDENMARSQLTYYIDMLQKYLQFNAGCFCLSMLNQNQPIAYKNQFKQFIDFQSQQYSQAHENIFFKQQLFGIKRNIKQQLNEGIKLLMFNKFTHGAQKIPYIQIKQSVQRKQNKKKDLDESLPFACQITQINIKGNEKITPKQTVNIESSNLIFDDLGMGRQLQQVDKIEQFLKGLYLATEKTSKNYQLLNQNKIKLIINCAATTCKNWFINDVNYKWIDMADPVQSNKNQYNIQCLIYQVADLAAKCLAQPAGVLIHCSGYNPKIQYSGSRSVAILIGIIMSSLKLSYDDAYNMVNKKWPIKIPPFMQKQLKNLNKRSKQKQKGFNIYSICSYSKHFPKHLVAKYLCEIQQIQNLQGIDKFQKSVFLCVSHGGNKIMWGRECQYKQDYQKYAKQQLRLLNKYEKIDGQFIIEPIQKTFRKQPKIQVKQQILHMDTKSVNKSAGFLRNQQLVLKYPILRPVWQKKKQDAFYFTIRQKNSGAQVIMNKGMNWIGYQSDKQQFFDRIISCYLGHIPHDKIFILQSEQDQSLFDASQINL